MSLECEDTRDHSGCVSRLRCQLKQADARALAECQAALALVTEQERNAGKLAVAHFEAKSQAESERDMARLQLGRYAMAIEALEMRIKATEAALTSARSPNGMRRVDAALVALRTHPDMETLSGAVPGKLTNNAGVRALRAESALALVRREYNSGPEDTRLDRIGRALAHQPETADQCPSCYAPPMMHYNSCAAWQRGAR